MNGPLRIIFSVAVLAMWILFGVALSRGTWTPVQWVMLLVAHAGCAIVFYNFAWIFSYGYAISVTATSLVILVALPSMATTLVAGGCLLYGLRLWWYVHVRHRDASYREIGARGTAMHGTTPLPAKLFIWVMVSWLMAFHAMTSWNVATAGRLTAGVVAGAIVMLAGLALEALADAQKLAAKQRDASRWVDSGVYRRIRHPNYLGEIVFQVGLIVAALGSAGSLFWLAAGVVAPLYVIALMWYAAEELDEKQLQRYGAQPAYLEYRAATGTLFAGTGARSPAAG